MKNAKSGGVNLQSLNLGGAPVVAATDAAENPKERKRVIARLKRLIREVDVLQLEYNLFMKGRNQ